MRRAWETGKQVAVHGWVYELDKGVVRDLGVSVGPVSGLHATKSHD